MVTTNHSLPSDSDFARFEGELFARIDRQHRGRVVLHRLVAGAALVVLAGAGVAAGTVANPAQQSLVANCYSAANTASTVRTTLLSDRPGSRRPSAAKIERGVEGCASLWQRGVMGDTSRNLKLQPCLRDDLIISVFPRKSLGGNAEGFCERFGMSAP